MLYQNWLTSFANNHRLKDVPRKMNYLGEICMGNAFPLNPSADRTVGTRVSMRDLDHI
jgi:hypothetical protein